MMAIRSNSAKIAAAGFVLAILAACSGADRSDAALADSAGRDLQLAPSDSTAPLNDRAAGAASASGSTSRSGTSATSSSGARASASSASLAAGTVVTARMGSRISSRTNKAGETVTATVSSAVRDGSGRVVIPAGATVSMRITKIHESENKSDNTGTLVLDVVSVAFGGNSYPMSGTVHATSSLVGRSTNGGDVAKVGVGAGVGAVAGRVLGGSKGTVIGGVLGGAVGAQRAVETKDRDIVVAADSPVRITLDTRFVASR